MTKMKSTKRALIASFLVLVMCISMLVGSTFAWFTDSVTSGSNKIIAGNLDVELYHSDKTATDEKVNYATKLFDDVTLWEPGAMAWEKLTVKNLGSLALKYTLSVNVSNVSVVEGKSLADVLKVAVMTEQPTRENIKTAATQDLQTFALKSDGNLEAKTGVDEFYVAIYWAPSANDNDYNVADEKLFAKLGVTLVATQVTVESDSFDDQYDANATYPQVITDTYGGGNTITVGDVSVTLPATAEKGIYTLKVDNIMKETDVTGQTTLSLNIDLLKNGVKVNAEPGVTYQVDIYVGKNVDVTDVKHKGESIIGFIDDFNTGIVSFNTDSFSPFEIVYKTLAAKVGDTVYFTIDEAIANWKNNTTLTLLSDVTLSDVIKLSSTEYHILDLGTYTLTAASGKDAIQYVVNGRSSAGYALDIKADTTNPGGITATGKAIVSHIKPSSGAPAKDRPITRFYGGVFNASYVVKQGGTSKWGFLTSGYTGASAPYFQFYGGEFNGIIYTNRSQNQFHGGTFNSNMQMSVDSSAYTLVVGGTFKQLSNSMGSALNNDKFTIGSGKGVFDREVYVNDDGYFVVASTKPANIEASVEKNPGTNDYLAYSKVKTEGKLNYTDVYVALKNNKSAKITVYVDELDLAGISFTGTIIVPEGNNLSITNAPNNLIVEGNVTYH